MKRSQFCRAGAPEFTLPALSLVEGSGVEGPAGRYRSVGRPCEASPPDATLRSSEAPSLRSTRIAAAILAGGAASRWGGRPKGLVRLPGGLSIIERTIGVAADSGIHDVAIIANDPAPYLGLGLEIVPDRRPGLGPLAGIEAALMHFADRCDGMLVLPCDLPAITGRELSALTRCFAEVTAPVVVAETGDSFWQPLCAIVRADILPAVTKSLDEGQRGVYRLWREIGALPLPFPDPRPFFNINTPADLACWVLAQEEPNVPFANPPVGARHHV